MSYLFLESVLYNLTNLACGLGYICPFWILTCFVLCIVLKMSKYVTFKQHTRLYYFLNIFKPKCHTGIFQAMNSCVKKACKSYGEHHFLFNHILYCSISSHLPEAKPVKAHSNHMGVNTVNLLHQMFLSDSLCFLNDNKVITIKLGYNEPLGITNIFSL